MSNPVTSANKPHIAISYNQAVGGCTSDTMRYLLSAGEIPYYDLDYRNVLNNDVNIDQIYCDANFLQAKLQTAKTNARVLLKEADGLILPGNNAQIDPRLFGQPLGDVTATEIDIARAIAEMALAHVAMDRGMPILGVCGGHHLLNVYLGGKVKALPFDQENHAYFNYSPINFDADSEIGKIIFNTKDSLALSGPFFCAHKQAVSEIGGADFVNHDGLLKAVACTPEAGYSIIEALENSYGSPIYSLQFHPEVAIAGMYSVLFKKNTYQSSSQETVLANLRILKAFEQACETFKSKRNVNADINEINSMEEADAKVRNINTPKLKNKHHSMFSLFNETKSQLIGASEPCELQRITMTSCGAA